MTTLKLRLGAPKPRDAPADTVGGGAPDGSTAAKSSPAKTQDAGTAHRPSIVLSLPRRASGVPDARKPAGDAPPAKVVLSVPKSAAHGAHAGPEQHSYEEHVALRVPEDVARLLAGAFGPPAGATPIGGTGAAEGARLELEWLSGRAARMTVCGPEGAETLLGVLLDLPTVSETYRACEGGAHHIKVADVAQVLEAVRVDGFGADSSVESCPAAAEILRGYAATDYTLGSGLTPPMAHVVSRRFARATLPSLSSRTPGGSPPGDAAAASLPPASLASLAALDRRVAEMLARDASASSSVFEIADAASGAALYVGGTGLRFLARADAAPGDDDGLDEEDEDGLFDESVAETSTAAGASADEGSDEDFAAELEEELLATQSPASAEKTHEDAPAQHVPPAAQPPAAMEEDVRAKIAARRAQLASVANPLIRARLEDAIRQMEDDLARRA